MIDPHDTIVALATPPGGALRGIVRLSGPRACETVAAFFQPSLPAADAGFRPYALSGRLSLPPLTASVPATLYLSRSPRSFTGQDLVEIHTLGSPPILQLAITTFVSRGARPAIAGEFTMRAFLNGKLDLTEAEAVLGLIDAASSKQAAAALRQMAGGIARPVQRLRDQLLDLLAELEAGLDFAEEDLEFIDRHELQASLQVAGDDLRRLDRQMQGRTLSDDRRRAVLVGPPNVGKSSLFNALLGRDAALVNQIAGTTRDYLVGQLPLGDCAIELVDTAGIDEARDAIGRQAQSLRDQVAGDADLLLWCVDARETLPPETAPADFLDHAKQVQCRVGQVRAGPPVSADFLDHTKQVLRILTKTDLVHSSACPAHPSPLTTHLPVFPVSALTGAGLAELRTAMAEWVRGSDEGTPQVVAGTAVRCRQAIAGAQATIERALAAVNSDASGEFIALELRLALDELGQVVGAVYTDDILDRIFSRF